MFSFKSILIALLGAGVLLCAPTSPAQQILTPPRPGATAPVTASPYNLRPYHDQARRMFLSGNAYQTAVALQDAAAEVERADVDDNGPHQPFLTQVRDNLSNLALSASQGKLGGLDAINQAFADGYRAMADFFYDQAREAWEAQSEAGTGTEAMLEGYPAGNPATYTGYYLRATAENVQNWAEASGKTLSRPGIDLINNTESISGRLMQSAGTNAAAVRGILEDLGKMMPDFNRWVEPAPAPRGPRGRR